MVHFGSAVSMAVRRVPFASVVLMIFLFLFDFQPEEIISRNILYYASRALVNLKKDEQNSNVNPSPPGNLLHLKLPLSFLHFSNDTKPSFSPLEGESCGICNPSGNWPRRSFLTIVSGWNLFSNIDSFSVKTIHYMCSILIF